MAWSIWRFKSASFGTCSLTNMCTHIKSSIWFVMHLTWTNQHQLVLCRINKYHSACILCRPNVPHPPASTHTHTHTLCLFPISLSSESDALADCVGSSSVIVSRVGATCQRPHKECPMNSPGAKTHSRGVGANCNEPPYLCPHRDIILCPVQNQLELRHLKRVWSSYRKKLNCFEWCDQSGASLVPGHLFSFNWKVASHQG